MSTYKIVRWDAVLNDCTIIPKPFIYFYPDLELLEFLKRNNFRVRITIHGSDSKYDGGKIWAIAKKSTFAAGCRPNFFEGTELWVLTLDVIWNGYPKNLGNFTVVKGPVVPALSSHAVSSIQKHVEQAAAEEQKKSKHVSWKKPVENAEQEPVANNSQTSNSSRLSTSQIIGIILAVIVFILFSFFIGYLINKNNV
jgi:hypothetical protein